MALIRAFENAAEEASRGGVAVFGASLSDAKVRGPLHLSTGQEAVPAGVCANLLPGDQITSTHRGHGHTIAKGASIEGTMCELFGRATGFNGGKGGSMHIADFSVGMLGANGVVAAGIPIAVGAAQAARVLGRDTLVVCFFGDGAINRGPFLEGLNWARVYGLRVLFVCEDNRWSATTATDAMTAGGGALARARALDVPGLEVDGNDVLAVDAAAAALIAEIRAGGGPRFLHAITYRVKGHVSVDAAAYRAQDEVSRALEQDPLLIGAGRLTALGASAAQLAGIRAEAEAEVAAAVRAATAAPWPEPAAAYTDIQDTGAGRWE
ncbi:MAG: thiamine pyrophosphate-dependent dehydrogenase E1 component subunit alpha [Betaproteobacteria bacterium]|nr:thiamine pyrophosphate-dependent dehydrogenase E1 component subunit alpha [Betaproteobacteria bacterium]